MIAFFWAVVILGGINAFVVDCTSSTALLFAVFHHTTTVHPIGLSARVVLFIPCCLDCIQEY
jgi:hypothetical protein